MRRAVAYYIADHNKFDAPLLYEEKTGREEVTEFTECCGFEEAFVLAANSAIRRGRGNKTACEECPSKRIVLLI